MTRVTAIYWLLFGVGLLVAVDAAPSAGQSKSGTPSRSKPSVKKPATTKSVKKTPANSSGRSAVRGTAASTDWPQFRGPQGLGVSADTGLPTTWSATENVRWKADLPGPGTSSPIVVGDRVYLTCYDGDSSNPQRKLVCVQRSDGEIVWTTDVKSELPEQDRIRDNHGYASSTPACDGEQLFVFFGKSGVFAFDMQGKQQWRTRVGDGLNGWGSAASPVLYENLVIVNASVESSSLVALDKQTGNEVWRAGGIKESWNTPILVSLPGGKTELVVAIMGKVLGFDPKSGEALWSCATDIQWYMAPSLVAHEGIVYCVGGRSGGALAVRAGGRGDVTSSHRIWTGRKGSNVTSPIYHDGHLYWMHESQGIAYCAKAADGSIVYENRVDRGDQVYASPVLADGKLYYFSRNGRAYVMPAEPKYELLAINVVEERGMFNGSPAVSAGELFVRSDRALYCLSKR